MQFTDLESSGSFSLGTASNGITYAWGDNSYGQLGNGAVGTEALTPVSVQTAANAAPLELLSAAGDHAFARGADGVVYGWFSAPERAWQVSTEMRARPGNSSGAD